MCVCVFVGCFKLNGPLRQYFNLYRAVSQKEGERKEMIDESKNVQTTPTRTYCKRSRPCPTMITIGRTPRHWKSRKENPQKLTQFNSRSYPRHLVGKRTAQKDTTIDTTSNSQVNSNFPYKWSPASLTFNNYLTYFYIYI